MSMLCDVCGEEAMSIISSVDYASRHAQRRNWHFYFLNDPSDEGAIRSFSRPSNSETKHLTLCKKHLVERLKIKQALDVINGSSEAKLCEFCADRMKKLTGMEE